MRFSSVLLSGAAITMASASSPADEPFFDCVVEHAHDMATYADCGHQGSLAKCLQKLASLDQDDIRACYVDAGCSPYQAWAESEKTLDRCRDMAASGELKRRFRAAAAEQVAPRADASTTADAASATTDAASATSDTQTGGVMSGTRCFTSGKKSTSSCEITTSGKHVSTGSCVPTTVTTSSCAPSLICTVDSSNQDICMELVHMTAAGIVVTLVFAGAILLGIAALTWACCKDRKQQKRLVAKAEAVALARAATKKQRAAQRQPLIRNPSGGSNPFQDQARA